MSRYKNVARYPIVQIPVMNIILVLVNGNAANPKMSNAVDVKVMNTVITNANVFLIINCMF